MTCMASSLLTLPLIALPNELRFLAQRLLDFRALVAHSHVIVVVAEFPSRGAKRAI